MKTLKEKEHDRKYQARRRKENPKWKLEQTLKYYRENPEKTKAYYKFRLGIHKGIIIKKPCVVCGKLKVHGHHQDYSKPLEVIWLCSEHHKRLHLGLIKINNMEKQEFYKGDTALLEISEKVFTEVKVLEVFNEYGRIRYKVAPITGKGEMKVENLVKA